MLSASLPPQDLLDPPGGVPVTTPTGLGCDKPSAASAKVRFDGFSRHFGNGRTATSRLMPKARIELVGEFDRCPFHGMPAYHPDLVSSRTMFESR